MIRDGARGSAFLGDPAGGAFAEHDDRDRELLDPGRPDEVPHLQVGEVGEHVPQPITG